jgi:DNA-binding response OmpR family regulator
LRWPRDAGERDRLTREGVPRILLVAGDQPPPLLHDELEDWIRTPADEHDLFLRIRHLEHQREQPDSSAVADGVVRHGSATVVLSPAQARLATLLFRLPWRLVPRDALADAWGGESGSSRTLDGAIARLRAKLEPLGLTVSAIRGRGFALHQIEVDDV